MNQISIKEKKIKLNITNVINLMNERKSFLIDIDGNINIDNNLNSSTPIVFRYESSQDVSKIVDAKTTLENIFSDYKIVFEGFDFILNLLPAWQKIILLNQNRMLYFDHQTDGVELFEDKELEDMCWNTIVCDIPYREISNFIEENCAGTLVFYDNEIQFNGFVLVDDIDEVRVKVKNYIIRRINEKINDESIDIEDDDVIESLEYFNIKV